MPSNVHHGEQRRIVVTDKRKGSSLRICAPSSRDRPDADTTRSRVTCCFLPFCFVAVVEYPAGLVGGFRYHSAESRTVAYAPNRGLP